MSDEAVYHDAPKTQEYGQTTTTAATVKVEPESETVEKADRGLFDFSGKKKEEENKYEETPISSSEYEQKLYVSESEPKTQEYSQTTATIQTQEYGETPTATVKVEPESETVEKEDRGLFDFLGKKKEEENKYEETPISSTEYEQKVEHVSESEPKSEEQPETLFQKMHISHSGSSSSSDEEGEDLTEQLKEKIEERKERKEEEETIKKLEDDNCVPIEKYEEEVAVAPPAYNTDVGTHAPVDVVHHAPTSTPEPQEKKGLMEKIKEKLPGHKKPVEEELVAPPPPTPVAPVVAAHEEEPEKKGIFEKIKEKIQGNHSKSEEEKEKEKTKESY